MQRSLDEHVRGFAKQVLRSRRITPQSRASRKLEERGLAPRPSTAATQAPVEAPAEEGPGSDVTVSASEARPSDVQVCACSSAEPLHACDACMPS